MFVIIYKNINHITYFLKFSYSRQRRGIILPMLFLLIM